MLSDPQVGRDVFFVGITLKRQEGDWLAITLYKKDSFLYHISFSYKVPQMAPFITNAAFY